MGDMGVTPDLEDVANPREAAAIRFAARREAIKNYIY
jgi:hypothetical protein